MSDEYEFTLNSPFTDEDWDKITDTEFENTDRVTFRTKSGKTVEFAKVSEEFEWCHDCKEYDQEAHCCHRWTKVIRNTVEELKIIHCRDCKFGEVDNPCFPDQYFCHHNGCDWNLGGHYCGYAERREKTNEGNH